MKVKIFTLGLWAFLVAVAVALWPMARPGRVALAQGQQTVELACPAGMSVFPGWQVFNPVTGNLRQVVCIDGQGHVYMQPDSVAGAIPSLPISLTSGVSGILPSGNGGTGNNTGNAPTASALASAPTKCSAGSAAIGIAANGNAQGCFTPAVEIVLQITSDQATTGTALANLTGMSFAVSANTNYRALCTILHLESAANPVFSFSGPTSPTLVGFSSPGSIVITAFGSNLVPAGSTSEVMQQVHFVLLNGANSGTVQMEFANNTSGDTTTVKSGSFCIVQ